MNGPLVADIKCATIPLWSLMFQISEVKQASTMLKKIVFLLTFLLHKYNHHNKNRTKNIPSSSSECVARVATKLLLTECGSGPTPSLRPLANTLSKLAGPVVPLPFTMPIASPLRCEIISDFRFCSLSKLYNSKHKKIGFKAFRRRAYAKLKEKSSLKSKPFEHNCHMYFIFLIKIMTIPVFAKMKFKRSKK